MTDPQPSPDVAIPGQPAEDLPKRFPLVTYGVIAISVALFALDDDSWIADAWHIYDGSFWSLITSAFFHVNLMHLAFNLYWLWVLGRCLERVVGSGRFLLLFAAAAWVSSAAQLAVSGQTGIGLSGVGYALFGAMWIAGKWVPAFRRVVDSPVIGLFLFWLCLCVGLSVVGDSQIGNTAHFAGLAFGMVLGASAQVPLRSRSVTAALLLVAASTATLLWAPWSSRWQGLQGQRAQDAGDLDRAMEAFTRFIELDPDHPWGYGERGWVHIEKGDFARAFADFNTVIQLDPLDTMAHSGRGCARRMSNDLEGAIADLDRAIQLDPAFAWNYGERARTRIAQADYGEAIADFSEAIKLDPESAAPYRGRGQARR